MSIESIFVNKENAVGEVAEVNNGMIEVLIYPEFHAKIKIGSIIIFDSEYVKPIGIVINQLHRTRHGHITPLRKPRAEILKAYPDLDKYHKYAVTVVYTSHYLDGKVRHYRSGMPRLHDLAFLVDKEEYLDAFFKPSGDWSLEFLEYYISAGAGPLEIREFLLTHLSYLSKNRDTIQEFLRELIYVAYKTKLSKFSLFLEEIDKILQMIESP